MTDYEHTNQLALLRQYQAWLAAPCVHRDPPTEMALAERMGVPVAVLRSWRQRDGFWDEVARLAEVQLRQRLPVILNTLADRAEDGDVAAARLILDALDQQTRQPAVTQVVNVASLTAADFAAILRDSEVWQALIREADRTEP